MHFFYVLIEHDFAAVQKYGVRQNGFDIRNEVRT